MVEKIITLENISLIDFFGVENKNINEVASSFPKSKIVSQGNEIHIHGESTEIIKISDILNALLMHYQKFGKITTDNVKNYLAEEVRTELANTVKEEVLVYGTHGIVVKPQTINQYKLVESVKQNDLVFALGAAGTGKTYVSVAMAVQALKNKEVRKIIITRPAVETGEALGFLPGDLKEKLDPYLRPIYDALHDMVPAQKLKHYLENGLVEIAPLAYMRGRTLDHAFILLDEAQNTTPMQIKMFLTRMGVHSKGVITGDLSQVDLPKRQTSGLADAVKTLKEVKGIGFVTLESKDVVRHKIVKAIIEAYGKEAKR